jgi:hypothetical protein
MVSFQAPFDIGQMRKQQLDEELMRRDIEQRKAQAVAQIARETVSGLANSYMDRKSNEASASAFGNILEMHGQSMFGESAGDLLARYKKGSLKEQLAMSQMLMGQPGQQIGRMNYLNRSGQIYGGGGGGGGGYGGGGGGGGGGGTLYDFGG